MGFLSFLGFYSKEKVNEIARDVTSKIVSIDPEGASEAQLNMMLEKLSEISKNVAKYRRAYQKDLAETEHHHTFNNGDWSCLECLDLEKTPVVKIEGKIINLLDPEENNKVFYCEVCKDWHYIPAGVTKDQKCPVCTNCKKMGV